MNEGLTPENLARAQDDIAMGQSAAYLLQDPTFKGAMDSIKRDTLDTLLASDPGSPRAVKFHYLYLAMELLEAEFTAAISKGKEATSIFSDLQNSESAQSSEPERIWIAPKE